MPSIIDLISQRFNGMFDPAPGSGYQQAPELQTLIDALQKRAVPDRAPGLMAMPTTTPRTGPTLADNWGQPSPPQQPPMTGVGGPPGAPQPPPMPMGQPPQPQMAQGPQGAPQGGIQGFLNGPKGDALMGLLQGWAQGGTWQESLGAGGAGAVAGMKQGKKNRTLQMFLDSQPNMDPAMKKLLADDPDLGRQYIAAMFKGTDGTDDMQEYAKARQQGFEGSFIEYQIRMKEAGRANTTVNLNDWKIPPGYRQDPNNPEAVVPIKGGPAETLPAELAARIGMADSFLVKAPTIRDQLVKGTATGPIDRGLAGSVQSSDQAQIYRQMESGTDALLRMLTGAGMPDVEAQKYVRRYLPTFTDDAASAARKLDQLVSELESIKSSAMRGRGGFEGTPPPSNDVIDYQDWLKQ